MSINFWIASEEPEVVDTWSCDCQDREDNKKPDPTCHFCNGTGTAEYRDRPNTQNFSNSNAFTVMRAFGYPLDAESYCGEIPVERLQGIFDAMCRATRSFGSTMYVHSAAARMIPLFEKALANNEPVVYG